MSEFADLARYYDAEGLYVRERRRFRRPFRAVQSRRRWRPKPIPDTRLIKPKRKHHVYGGRTGLLDRLQGVFGYFYGGGWIFGFVENERFRATTEAIDAYQQGRGTRGELRLPFWAGRLANLEPRPRKSFFWPDHWPLPQRLFVQPRSYVEIVVRRERFDKAGPLPKIDVLEPIDRLALQHDRDLRVLDEDVWTHRPDDGPPPNNDLGFRQANRDLLDGLQAIDWDSRFEGWRAAKDELPRALWEGMGSMIAYQKKLARFSIFALNISGAADVDEAAVRAPATRGVPLTPMSRTPRANEIRKEVARSESQLSGDADVIAQHVSACQLHWEDMPDEREVLFDQHEEAHS